MEFEREIAARQGRFFNRRIVQPILNLLRQGVTPQKMALSIALGIALGVFPAIGITTILCAVAALAFRLNLPAIQIVNYFVYPLQIALLLPFYRAGEWLFAGPRLQLSLAQVRALAGEGIAKSVGVLWVTIWHGAVVWCLVAPPFAAAAYLVILPVLRRALRRESPGSAAGK